MATYDNKHWLLTNIRNSFISTDDTGMCEIVMSGENYPKLFYNKAMEEKTRMQSSSPNKSKEVDAEAEERGLREIITEFDPYLDLEESDDEVDGSYIRYEDFGPHRYFGRQRSNTAQWLDKKEQALKKAAKIKVVKWETPAAALSNEEKAEIFTKNEVKPSSNVKKKSLLADQLEKCPHLPHRQYLEYAKYDGTAQLGQQTKTFKIFMTMLSDKHQNYPVVVCIIANAKIQDLIGFTCYKYSIEHPEISLGSAQGYGLCIAEDDGEVDWTFPCLDADEPCSKFGFTCLGLVELKNLVRHTPLPLPETGGFSGAFPMFTNKDESGQSNPDNQRQHSQTSDAVLYAIQAVNEDKKGHSRDKDTASHMMATDAPQYRAYRVQLLHRVRANTPVSLAVTLDRIEVEPLISGSHNIFSRKKFFMHSIDSVAWCQVLDARSSKATFRLVYSRNGTTSYDHNVSADQSGFFHPNSAFKHHDFECDLDTAREIVDKVNRILDLRNSPCRREYKTAKEKKLQTRRSFQHPKHLS
ncbi:hypothetical protein JYU34_010851 [Plutella xylostella]|uniref:Target of rapamycin complex 2 subunit MAPKAP1 n=1 Tax=Plutella xylostella TaxID=51655 RepID=A0ABQ7QFH0_PLUXY|nr:hypothetical protein JYU34_010851 [Plutella xylostella]